MSDENVIELRPTPSPKQMSETEINRWWELAKELTQKHAENLIADPTLGERLDRENQTEAELSQVGLESYIDCNGRRCYRPFGDGLRQRQMNRIRENYEYRRHVEAVYRELTIRRLDQIDPDWRDHYKTFDAAEQAYWLELQKLAGRVVDCGPFEPKDSTR